MGFAILRVEKLHQKGQVAASAAHLSRERECKNADPDRKRDNQVLAGAKSVAGVTQRWEKRLESVTRKVRPDAVTCLEFVITASPEWYASTARGPQDAYHKAAVTWLEGKFGKENVLQAVCHRDETSPHLHVLVMPIHVKTNAKGQQVTALAAKDFVDGGAKLSAMQTDFHQSVAQQFGLDRGVKGSVAHHARVKSFYGTLERDDPGPALETPKKRLFEPRKAHQKRATEIVREQAQGWAVAQRDLERQKAEKALKREREELEAEKAKLKAREAQVEAAIAKGVEGARSSLRASQEARDEIAAKYAELARLVYHDYPPGSLERWKAHPDRSVERHRYDPATIKARQAAERGVPSPTPKTGPARPGPSGRDDGR